MKKFLLPVVILLMCPCISVYAGTGGPKDGLEFILIFSGFLLLFVGISKGTDFLRKNRRMLMCRARRLIQRITAEIARIHFLITESDRVIPNQ